MMNINNLLRMLLIVGLSFGATQAQVVNVGFETDADGNSLVNGLAITEAPTGNRDIQIRDSDGPTIRVPEGDGSQLIAVSNFFTITSTGDEHVGAAIFDSTPFFSPGTGTSGPNTQPIPADDGDIADEDLLVNTGNVLILQEDSGIPDADTRRDDFGNLIFNQPDDDVNDGSIFFNFSEAVEAVSIDLVDFNGGASGEVTLTDVDGNERRFIVPEEFTFDIADVLDEEEGSRLGDGDPSNDPVEGFATLLFDELTPQEGEGRFDDDGIARLTSVSDTGDFDIGQVVTIEVAFGGPSPSGAIDNLVFSTAAIPEPSTVLLLGMGSVCLAARRRRTAAA